MHIPAICTSCQIVFRSGLFMEDSSGTVAGAKTICPRCLQPVEIASGAYSTAKTAMEFVAASSKDEAKMRAILALLGKAANRQITPETFEAEAAKIGPDAAKSSQLYK